MPTFFGNQFESDGKLMVVETQVPNKNKEYAAFFPVIQPLFCGTGLKY